MGACVGMCVAVASQTRALVKHTRQHTPSSKQSINPDDNKRVALLPNTRRGPCPRRCLAGLRPFSIEFQCWGSPLEPRIRRLVTCPGNQIPQTYTMAIIASTATRCRPVENGLLAGHVASAALAARSLSLPKTAANREYIPLVVSTQKGNDLAGHVRSGTPGNKDSQRNNEERDRRISRLRILSPGREWPWKGRARSRSL
jgi:hypothetical protein